jgi:intracellular multiplication protein IcmJ
MANATSYRTYAQDIYRNLKLRSQIVDKNLGEGLSDPSLLGRILIDAPEKQRSQINKEILQYLRLLPSYTKFSKQIDDWAKAAVDDLSTTETE